MKLKGLNKTLYNYYNICKCHYKTSWYKSLKHKFIKKRRAHNILEDWYDEIEMFQHKLMCQKNKIKKEEK